MSGLKDLQLHALLLYPDLFNNKTISTRRGEQRKPFGGMMSLMFGLLLIVLYGLLSARVLPIAVMRIWFSVVMLGVLIVTNLLTFVADSLKHVGVSAHQTKLMCTYICIVTFRAALLLNPHIKVRINEAQLKWASIPHPSVTAINHTSFWDAFVFVGSAPASYLADCKTLMKASLRKMPIFGPVYDRVGHFPVYFKSSADGDFSVDKEKQAAVAEKVAQHLADGGRIAVFPEGAVNKTPEKLTTFRHGSFALVLQHKLPLCYVLTVGNNDSWPAAASIGGYPADIEIHIGSMEVNHETDTAAAIAERLQEKMQRELDAILQRRKLATKTELSRKKEQ